MIVLQWAGPFSPAETSDTSVEWIDTEGNKIVLRWAGPNEEVIAQMEPDEIIAVVGPPGPPGNGVNFTQASPSTLWTIAHNLGVRPNVQTFTVGGVEMEGEVMHLSLNVLTIGFNIAVAGTARVV